MESQRHNCAKSVLTLQTTHCLVLSYFIQEKGIHKSVYTTAFILFDHVNSKDLRKFRWLKCSYTPMTCLSISIIVQNLKCTTWLHFIVQNISITFYKSTILYFEVPNVSSCCGMCPQLTYNWWAFFSVLQLVSHFIQFKRCLITTTFLQIAKKTTHYNNFLWNKFVA